MGSSDATEAGARDPPARRRGAVTAVLLAAPPLLLLLLFLFGDRAADALVRAQVKVKPQSPRNASSSSSSREPGAARDGRLLGGLLSPDFDGPACRSRYEGSRRWRPSPFPVSPYLVRKLRRYEANHRRCGPDTSRYREAMAQLQSGRNGDRGECRYVVWLPLQGLGNRMLSLVSTFLYAVLTGRVLLVHEPPEMEGLFCEPFPGTSWLLPASFPYKDVRFGSDSKESYVSMLQSNVVRYDHDHDHVAGNGNGNASALPAYVYLHLENMGLRLQNHTFCEEDHRALDGFNWMVLRSDSYFAVALFLVPTYRDELERMFPSKGSVFHHLGRYLLHPGNPAWGIAQRFFDGYLADADQRLGVQVRIVWHHPVPFDVMFDQILRCTREHALLPQLTGEPPADAGVNSTSNMNTTAKAKVKAVLVVSLKPEYYDKLHGMYYNNATASGELVTVYQPSHDQDQHTEARAHNERALAEIFLLSYCDEMVTTSWSTFGYVAHALAGLRPRLLAPLDLSKMRSDVACVRPASIEPCLHSPPSLVCRRAQDLDPVAHVPFLRHCEDVDFGLKLVD
ncbi:Galactoside 2-alpha-L-fucosyltransferase [Hordeum vulgare]|uniref:Fucosyltransferase n=1 Tax=Hordeum vulgare subsp. vulgare TaxID=112509 RepID=A0A8I6YT69_HORVV|nr:probable fucosyltransferase 7 [Hordeum vulgare subsp. vulgare]KAE8818354.1 Galactoside 2-alpha-L-fucosyltransferase [Hordeum vulgare]